jgi:hypothetical protein
MRLRSLADQAARKVNVVAAGGSSPSYLATLPSDDPSLRIGTIRLWLK